MSASSYQNESGGAVEIAPSLFYSWGEVSFRLFKQERPVGAWRSGRLTIEISGGGTPSAGLIC
jgi:hypothetical protein